MRVAWPSCSITTRSFFVSIWSSSAGARACSVAVLRRFYSGAELRDTFAYVCDPMTRIAETVCRAPPRRAASAISAARHSEPAQQLDRASTRSAALPAMESTPTTATPSMRSASPASRLQRAHRARHTRHRAHAQTPANQRKSLPQHPAAHRRMGLRTHLHRQHRTRATPSRYCEASSGVNYNLTTGVLGSSPASKEARMNNAALGTTARPVRAAGPGRRRRPCAPPAADRQNSVAQRAARDPPEIPPRPGRIRRDPPPGSAKQALAFVSS